MRKLISGGIAYRCRWPWPFGLLVLGMMMVSVPVGHAASLTWDANSATTPNPADGSGTWLTAGDWWNGTNHVSGNWTGATPDGAVFGAGASGAYTVTVGTVSANLVTFTNSGYTLANGTLTLPNNGAITVAAGQVASLNCTIYGANTAQYWTANSGSTLNLGGNVQSMQVRWQGTGTINLSGVNTPAIFWANATVNQTGGSVAPTAYLFIGYQGGPAAYTLNGASASLTMNGGDLTIARSGQTGSLTIQAGTVNLGTSSVRALNLASSDANGNNHATLNVQGGR